MVAVCAASQIQMHEFATWSNVRIGITLMHPYSEWNNIKIKFIAVRTKYYKEFVPHEMNGLLPLVWARERERFKEAEKNEIKWCRSVKKKKERGTHKNLLEQKMRRSCEWNEQTMHGFRWKISKLQNQIMHWRIFGWDRSFFVARALCTTNEFLKRISCFPGVKYGLHRKLRIWINFKFVISSQV